MYKKKQIINGGNYLHEIFIQTQAINNNTNKHNNNLTLPKGKVFKIYF